MRNPEFVRNLWLQISPVRLLTAVGVLAVVVAVVLVSVKTGPLQSLADVSSVALVVALCAWGASAASATVRDEIRENTWNQQRMSGLTPWQITWGKLFGGTAYVWWVSLWILIVLAVARIAANDTLTLATEIATWVTIAIAIHALSMVAALGFRSSDGSRVEAIPLGIAAIAAIVTAQFVLSVALKGHHEQIWLGSEYSSVTVSLILAVPAMFWSVIGAYRSIRRELQEPLLPWALPACALTFGFLFAGFGDEVGSMLYRGLGVSLFLTTLLTWAAFLVEPHSAADLSDCITKFLAGQRRAALLQLSTSAALLALLLALALICATVSIADSRALATYDERTSIGVMSKAAPWGFLWIMIVAIRDFLVAHALQRISKTSRRAMGAFVVYLGIMYVAVPLALGGVFDKHAVKWWLPMSGPNDVSGAPGLVGPLLTLGVVIALCIRFFGRRDGVDTPKEN